MGILLNRRIAELVGVVGVLVLLATMPTLPSVQLCPFKFFTGVPCPTCGVTRGLFALLHGQIVLATHLNPLAFVVAIILLRRLLVLTLLPFRIATILAASSADRAIAIIFFVVGAAHYVLLN